MPRQAAPGAPPDTFMLLSPIEKSLVEVLISKSGLAVVSCTWNAVAESEIFLNKALPATYKVAEGLKASEPIPTFPLEAITKLRVLPFINWNCPAPPEFPLPALVIVQVWPPTAHQSHQNQLSAWR